jgi:hypothetical protein
MARAVSVPPAQAVGLANSAARPVSVPALYGVKVSEGAGLDVETIAGCPEQAIILNRKTRNRKDCITLTIASLLRIDDFDNTLYLCFLFQVLFTPNLMRELQRHREKKGKPRDSVSPWFARHVPKMF